MSLSSHQSARPKTVDWLTPPEWLTKLGPFDLDPCCPHGMPWHTAGRMVSLPEDGLAIDWYGRVWLNPPFGNQAWPWVQKLARHGNGIALIPARTETVGFYQSVWYRADAVCFVKGRPHFHHLNGSRAKLNSGAPIALAAYGAENVRALLTANIGVVVNVYRAAG